VWPSQACDDKVDEIFCRVDFVRSFVLINKTRTVAYKLINFDDQQMLTISLELLNFEKKNNDKRRSYSKTILAKFKLL
jgi:hypothetical protein